MLGLSSALLSSVPGVSHRFFQRAGGTSPHPWRTLNVSLDVGDAPARVHENLARVRFQLGVGRAALFTARQVHGARVLAVEADHRPDDVALEEADGLCTAAAGLGVGVRTADCAPLLLAVDDGSAVAALHAGWRGAVGGVIEAGVAALCARAATAPARIVAAVGPCIGAHAFEVGPEVVAAVARVTDDVTGLVRAGGGDRSHVDLAGLCLALLRRAGVERAERVGGCTVTELELYFSHRAEHGVTGRQMSCIALAAPPLLDDEAFA